MGAAAGSDQGGDPQSGADLTERGSGCAIKTSWGTKDGKHPFLPKVPQEKAFPEVETELRLSTSCGKSRSSITGVFSTDPTKAWGNLSFPCWDLGEGVGKGELGMQLAKPKHKT